MHAALHDDIGIGLGGLARKLQRVADDVGDAIVDFRRLVIMRQDDGVALFLQPVDRVHIGGEERPFHRRNDVFHALIEMRGLTLHFRVPFQRRHGQDRKARRRAAACGAGRLLRATGPSVSMIGMAASHIYALNEHISGLKISGSAPASPHFEQIGYSTSWPACRYPFGTGQLCCDRESASRETVVTCRRSALHARRRPANLRTSCRFSPLPN